MHHLACIPLLICMCRVIVESRWFVCARQHVHVARLCLRLGTLGASNRLVRGGNARALAPLQARLKTWSLPSS